MSSPQTPPPGWYPDPSDPTRHRWWTGVDWSDETTHTAATTAETPEPAPEPAADPAPPRLDPGGLLAAAPSVVAPSGGLNERPHDDDARYDHDGHHAPGAFEQYRLVIVAAVAAIVVVVAALVFMSPDSTDTDATPATPAPPVTTPVDPTTPPTTGGEPTGSTVDLLDPPTTADPTAPPTTAPATTAPPSTTAPVAATDLATWAQSADGQLVTQWVNWWNTVAGILPPNSTDPAVADACRTVLDEHTSRFGPGANSVAAAAANAPDTAFATAAAQALNNVNTGLDTCAARQEGIAAASFTTAAGHIAAMAAALG